MVAETLWISKFLLCVLYSCHMKFYLCYIFLIHIIYFIIYFLYIERNYLKERRGLIERPLRMSAPRHSWKIQWAPWLKWAPPRTWLKWPLIWKLAMAAEALIKRICKNDETRVFFNQISFEFCFLQSDILWILAICHKQTFYLVFYILFSLGNDKLTSTYFAFF